MKQYLWELKIVMGLPWERFQILNFCVVITHSFPFLPLLRHYVLLLQSYSYSEISSDVWAVSVSQIVL